MRDPNRIKPFLEEFENILKINFNGKTSSEVLNKFIEKVESDCFYMEDETFLEKFREMADENKTIDKNITEENHVEDEFLKKVKKDWKKVPDWRFMQFYNNTVL